VWIKLGFNMICVHESLHFVFRSQICQAGVIPYFSEFFSLSQIDPCCWKSSGSYVCFLMKLTNSFSFGMLNEVKIILVNGIPGFFNKS
jgi:hypothetical protein